jgi:hypothetical protein
MEVEYQSAWAVVLLKPAGSKRFTLQFRNSSDRLSKMRQQLWTTFRNRNNKWIMVLWLHNETKFVPL